MKIQSCDNCAVLLDGDKLQFPADVWRDDGSIDPAKAAYRQETKTFDAYVPCPVCGGKVFKE